MRVVRLHAARDLRLHDEPMPVPGATDVLVRVTAVGVCGSDLHWFSEAGIGDAKIAQPLVLGHEFAGVIESSQRRGERVAIDPAVPCEQCELCRAGNPNLCVALHFAGHGLDDGALREYMAWPERCLHPLPDSLTDADGAMLEPLGVALHAVDLGKVKPGMTVGVFGCGPIGLLVVQVARAAGAARIIATDKFPHRLEAARSFGATGVIQAHAGQEDEEVWAATNKEGVEVAFECAGENEAVEAAMAASKPGGRIILVGIPADDRTTFAASNARRKGLTIKLSRRMKHTYPRTIRLAESRRVDVRSLVSHRFPLDKTPDAFAVAQRREGLKVIIEPQTIGG